MEGTQSLITRTLQASSATLSDHVDIDSNTDSKALMTGPRIAQLRQRSQRPFQQAGKVSYFLLQYCYHQKGFDFVS